jgi:hypothetical protein
VLVLATPEGAALSADDYAARLTRARRDDEVEIVVCVSEPEFQALSKLALDEPGTTVGDVASRLLCERLDELVDDL